MDNRFEEIELYEKNGISKLKINGNKINSLTGYCLKRSTDMVDLTFSISVPISNLKTIEN